MEVFKSLGREEYESILSNRSALSLNEEGRYIKGKMTDIYIHDNDILRAVRDYCPLEYLDFGDNKYFSWLSNYVVEGIFANSSSFTKEVLSVDIPEEFFCDGEVEVITNLIKRMGIDFGLVVTRAGPRSLYFRWKREYNLNDCILTNSDKNRLNSKFKKIKDSENERRKLENEIEDGIIKTVREKIINGEKVVCKGLNTNKEYSISEVIDILGKKFDC